MFDPTEAIEKLQAEINRTLKELSKAKNIEEKLKLSELLMNLAQSLNVYFDFLGTLIDSELDRFRKKRIKDYLLSV
jgi:prefoldin subunit 5